MHFDYALFWLATGLVVGCIITLAGRNLMRRIGPSAAFLLGALVSLSLTGIAAQVSVTQFTNGEVADASQINANFDGLAAESNSQDTRIAFLEANVATRPVSNAEIGSSAISNSKIAASAVTSDKIANNTIVGDDLNSTVFSFPVQRGLNVGSTTPGGERQTTLGTRFSRFCFLAGMRVAEADSTSELGECRVFLSNDNWVLRGEVEAGNDNRVTCWAQCLSW